VMRVASSSVATRMWTSGCLDAAWLACMTARE
jgi:hypothetical protein